MNYFSVHYLNYLSNTNLLLTIATAYLPSIFIIKWWMKDRPPYKNNLLLGAWNLFLGVSSAYGAYYTLPYLANDIVTNGFINSVCTMRVKNNDLISHINILFTISKFFEFIDTFFIVFRKADLDFLHYYHHITVCLYTWNSAYLQTSTGIYFVSVNLFVHAIMYTYFALAAFNIRILHPYRKLITIIQTTQMGLGAFVICTWLSSCTGKNELLALTNDFFAIRDINAAEHIVIDYPLVLNHLAGLAMYVSYGYLFTKLFFKPKKEKHT